jgi:ankyrin repeat protein
MKFQVNTLLAANADIRIRDKEGNTPLHLLFLKRRDLLRESRSSKQNKSSALEETVH